MWHDMAIIILCFWSPSPKHRHDLHRHRLDTLISIVASWSSCQLLLLWLSLTHSDKVKQLHGDRNSYNKTTIWLLPIANNLQNMIISYNNVYHIMSWPYHITTCPCKNKLDFLYFVVASFTWLLWASSKNRSYLRIKPQWCFVKFVVLTFFKDRP